MRKDLIGVCGVAFLLSSHYVEGMFLDKHRKAKMNNLNMQIENLKGQPPSEEISAQIQRNQAIVNRLENLSRKGGNAANKASEKVNKGAVAPNKMRDWSNTSTDKADSKNKRNLGNSLFGGKDGVNIGGRTRGSDYGEHLLDLNWEHNFTGNSGSGNEMKRISSQSKSKVENGGRNRKKGNELKSKETTFSGYGLTSDKTNEITTNIVSKKKNSNTKLRKNNDNLDEVPFARNRIKVTPNKNKKGTGGGELIGYGTSINSTSKLDDDVARKKVERDESTSDSETVNEEINNKGTLKSEYGTKKIKTRHVQNGDGRSPERSNNDVYHNNPPTVREPSVGEFQEEKEEQKLKKKHARGPEDKQTTPVNRTDLVDKQTQRRNKRSKQATVLEIDDTTFQLDLAAETEESESKEKEGNESFRGHHSRNQGLNSDNDDIKVSAQNRLSHEDSISIKSTSDEITGPQGVEQNSDADEKQFDKDQNQNDNQQNTSETERNEDEMESQDNVNDSTQIDVTQNNEIEAYSDSNGQANSCQLEEESESSEIVEENQRPGKSGSLKDNEEEQTVEDSLRELDEILNEPSEDNKTENNDEQNEYANDFERREESDDEIKADKLEVDEESVNEENIAKKEGYEQLDKLSLKDDEIERGTSYESLHGSDRHDGEGDELDANAGESSDEHISDTNKQIYSEEHSDANLNEFAFKSQAETDRNEKERDELEENGEKSSDEHIRDTTNETSTREHSDGDFQEFASGKDEPPVAGEDEEPIGQHHEVDASSMPKISKESLGYAEIDSDDRRIENNSEGKDIQQGASDGENVTETENDNHYEAEHAGVDAANASNSSQKEIKEMREMSDRGEGKSELNPEDNGQESTNEGAEPEKRENTKDETSINEEASDLDKGVLDETLLREKSRTIGDQLEAAHKAENVNTQGEKSPQGNNRTEVDPIRKEQIDLQLADGERLTSKLGMLDRKDDMHDGIVTKDRKSETQMYSAPSFWNRERGNKLPIVNFGATSASDTDQYDDSIMTKIEQAANKEKQQRIQSSEKMDLDVEEVELEGPYTEMTGGTNPGVVVSGGSQEDIMLELPVESSVTPHEQNNEAAQMDEDNIIELQKTTETTETSEVDLNKSNSELAENSDGAGEHLADGEAEDTDEMQNLDTSFDAENEEVRNSSTDDEDSKNDGGKVEGKNESHSSGKNEEKPEHKDGEQTTEKDEDIGILQAEKSGYEVEANTLSQNESEHVPDTVGPDDLDEIQEDVANTYRLDTNSQPGSDTRRIVHSNVDGKEEDSRNTSKDGYLDSDTVQVNAGSDIQKMEDDSDVAGQILDELESGDSEEHRELGKIKNEVDGILSELETADSANAQYGNNGTDQDENEKQGIDRNDDDFEELLSSLLDGNSKDRISGTGGKGFETSEKSADNVGNEIELLNQTKEKNDDSTDVESGESKKNG